MGSIVQGSSCWLWSPVYTPAGLLLPLNLPSAVDTFCHRLAPTLTHLTFAQRRQLVELLIARVIVTDGQVEIRYVVPTGPKGETTLFCHLRLDYLHGMAYRLQRREPLQCL